jgi:hypothetical protein
MSDNKDTGLSPAALVAMLSGDMENFMAAAVPGGIEAQEAQGQKDFVASETLPTECPREKLESLGFVFGEAADDIFTYVQFPEGWSKVPTDHSMWSDLVDDQGRKRGGIFYKAAFYDRNAHMSLDRKITISPTYEHHNGYVENGIQWFVTDGENILYEAELVMVKKKYEGDYWDLDDASEKEVRAWVEENYPNYNDPMAYWD